MARANRIWGQCRAKEVRLAIYLGWRTLHFVYHYASEAVYLHVPHKVRRRKKQLNLRINFQKFYDPSFQSVEYCSNISFL